MGSDNESKYDPSVSPKIKNKNGKLVRSGQKQMIINLYKELKEREPNIKYSTLLQTLSNTSGIGQSTIKKTLAEYRNSGRVSSPTIKRSRKQLIDKLENIELQSIRQKVHSFWFKREVPTLDKILQVINDDPGLVNIPRATLYRLLIKLEFTFTEKKKHSVLTEKDDLIIRRRNYLYDVRKFRAQGRPIYYLDETWVNVDDCCNTVKHGITIKSEYDITFESMHDTTVKLEYDTTFESKHDITVESNYDTIVKSKYDAFDKKISTSAGNPTGKGLIVLHIGSNKGFLPSGLMCFESSKNTTNYHEMNSDNFKDWFERILPKLERNSVIVMDTVPYHSEKLEKIPSFTWKKQDIFNWLKSKGETFDRPMLKPMLLERVRQIKSKFSTYIIDYIAQNAGHTILRLPPFHYELNPIELAWPMVKQYVKQNNTTSKLSNVRNLLNESLTHITPQHWSNFIQRVIKEEDYIWEVDEIMDEMIDNMEPCLKGPDYY